ncbi:MAG: M28 family peptidase [Candidatus Brocadiae bacterium]|nr:M28 family peptidase [Candidatus Brocadiia bacterium]
MSKHPKSADPIRRLLRQIDEQRLHDDLFYLAKDPLPFRKINHTLPGHEKSTLDEADDFLQARLESCGYAVAREGCLVQAFRCDATKPKAHQYGTPRPDDPWYTAYNLYARKRGTRCPDEIIVLVTHKDSQSWVDSAGAYDNAVGTVATLELARVLADVPTRRSLCFLFCNEEHWPWTSVTAARNARARGDDLVAIFNLDSLGGKSRADLRAGRKTNVTLYTCPEGETLADLMAEVNTAYRIGLVQSKHKRTRPGDDDGSFVNAGYPAAVANLGSYPYADRNYHLESDRPDFVDIPNVALAARATLAAVLRRDRA